MKAIPSKVNNDIYDLYGNRWYTADDDPVALLRAESKTKALWILQKLKQKKIEPAEVKILDVGCGAGFLSNELAKHRFQVTGVDLSTESLNVAKKHDDTFSVHYQTADAYHLPFADASFDVITAMDFLEHVEHPEQVIQEFSRVLKPNGLFFFHTFNRNALAYLVVIKLVEWVVKNTPKNMHVINLFIKPDELTKYCLDANLFVEEMSGLKPVFSSIPIKNYFTGIVPTSLKFELTKSLLLSYIGIAVKKNNH